MLLLVKGIAEPLNLTNLEITEECIR
jgi:hypothetical protein